MSLVEDVMADLEGSIDSSLSSLQADLAKLRTGRANVAILDGIRVDYYGVPTPLNQCANLMVVDARLITVKPWDKSLVSEVEKAIMTADIGITPQSDGEIIRLPVPALTEERRKEIVKQAKHRGEEARISLRGHRRDANDMLKEAEKDKEISQDDLKRALEKVQQVTDKGTQKVEDILATREKEILAI
jgi:ribosome recycling factor